MSCAADTRPSHSGVSIGVAVVSQPAAPGRDPAGNGPGLDCGCRNRRPGTSDGCAAAKCRRRHLVGPPFGAFLFAAAASVASFTSAGAFALAGLAAFLLPQLLPTAAERGHEHGTVAGVGRSIAGGGPTSGTTTCCAAWRSSPRRSTSSAPRPAGCRSCS
ncbi:hypothetical protein BN11_4610010 [Nostocoides australiense Ben110]|uniref:Uncharacterized protein n=1 Tax=Nostocoides australiense Ben110 TaxID=1193182 RepID=W6K0L4_9MICO|nr:hypothetical protein BN11_4610010 [Tetrasphaera australiensis Ben110]